MHNCILRKLLWLLLIIIVSCEQSRTSFILEEVFKDLVRLNVTMLVVLCFRCIVSYRLRIS